MKEFIPEKAFIVRRGKEIQIVAVQNARLCIYWDMARDIDASKEYERRRTRARKDKSCEVRIVHTLEEKEYVGKFVKPIHDFCYERILGKKIRLGEED